MEESVFSQSPFGTDSSSSSSASNGSSSKRGKKLIFLILLLIILGLIAFFAVKFLGGSSKPVAPTPTPTVAVTPTDTPTPTPNVSGSPTPKTTATPSPTAKTTLTPIPTKGATGGSVDKATGLDRAKLSIIVQNGSGVAGAAKTMGDKLTALGYSVSSVGNAATSDYVQTEIHVKTASSSYIPLLKKDLGTDYTIGTSASDYTGSGDALIIAGKQ